VIEPGGVAGRLWAGTMPGGLFRSDDGGESWSLNEALWHMPERRQWSGVAGGEQPGIDSVLIDPRNPSRHPHRRFDRGRVGEHRWRYLVAQYQPRHVRRVHAA
jgi:hypothetical protein